MLKYNVTLKLKLKGASLTKYAHFSDHMIFTFSLVNHAWLPPASTLTQYPSKNGWSDDLLYGAFQYILSDNLSSSPETFHDMYPNISWPLVQFNEVQ